MFRWCVNYDLDFFREVVVGWLKNYIDWVFIVDKLNSVWGNEENLVRGYFCKEYFDVLLKYYKENNVVVLKK